MMQKNRKGRIAPVRPILNVEALEERALLTGHSGVVTAMLDVKTGILMLQGDNGNNQFSIAPSPVAGKIRVAGKGLTAISGTSFVDFTLSSITDIQINLLNGQENVMIMGFTIPGTLTIN